MLYIYIYIYIYIKERLIGYKISLTSLLQNTNIQENVINYQTQQLASLEKEKQTIKKDFDS